MKPQIETSDGILGGRSVTYNIDLAKEGIQGNYSIDGLGFSKGSIQVFCSAGTGASGVAPIEQRNAPGGQTFPLTDPKDIAFTEGSVEGVFDISFTGRFLELDLSGVTFGDEGTVKIIFVLKL